MKTMKLILCLSIVVMYNIRAQISHNTTILSKWQSSSGPTTTIDSRGDTVFFNTNFTLNIVDFRKSSNPILLYQYNYFGKIKKIRQYDKFLVILIDYGFKIINIGDLDSVYEVWNLADASIRDFKLINSNGVEYLYLLYNTSFQTYIITNPTSAHQIVNFPLNFNVVDIDLSDNYLCAVYDKWVKLFSIENPEMPFLIGEYKVDGEMPGAEHIIITNNFIYATFKFQFYGPGGYIVSWHELKVLDYSNPSQIELINNYPNVIWVKGIFNKNRALIINGYNKNFEIYDLSSPSSLLLLYSFETIGDISDICLNGDNVFIGDGSNGVLKIDVLDNPVLLGRYQISPKSSNMVNIKKYGNYLYLIDNGALKLRVIDIDNVYNPIQTGEVSIEYTDNYERNLFDIANGYAFIVTLTDSNNIRINTIDISNPYNPISIGNKYVEGGDIFDVNISRNILYICRVSSIYIIDISNPFNLIVNAQLNPEYGALHSYAYNNYLYVVSNKLTLSVPSTQRIYIYDISDLSNPAEISHIDIPSESTDITSNKTTLFVSTYISGRLEIIDVSDPTKPQSISTLTNFVQMPWEVQIKDNYLYLVENNYGVRIFDISNPWDVQEVGLYKNQNTVRCDVFGDQFYTANRKYGISIMKNDLVTNTKDKNHFPTEYTLFQNFPNPFNPTTKIEYQMPEESSVKINIYDVLGRAITTLVNEEKQVGNYEVEFDGTGLPSGVYFYQLKAGNYTETKKMILMK